MTPVVVYVHGGGLEQDNTNAPDAYASAAPVLAAQSGIASVYFDYRVGRSPNQVVYASEDTACAVTWVERYLRPIDRRLDTAHLIVAGYSAGAALAATIAAEPSYLAAVSGNASDIAGVASMSGRYKYEIVPTGDVTSISDWESMHGTGNSPTDHLVKTAFPWLMTYEGADADTQYGNYDLMLARLRGVGNTVFGYENPDTNAHGQGLYDLANAGSPFYEEFVHFVARDHRVVATQGTEKLQLNSDRREPAAGIDFGAQDVAVGGDGAIWLVENPEHVPSAGNQYVAKYSNATSVRTLPSIGAFPFYEDLAVNECCASWIKAKRITVDGNGTPWVINVEGHLYEGVPYAEPPPGKNEYIVGSLSATDWTRIELPDGVVAKDVGAGGPLDKPALWIADGQGRLWQYHYQAKLFTQDPGPGPSVVIKRVAVSSESIPFAVDENGIFYWRQAPSEWLRGSGQPLVDIAAASQVFGVGKDERVYRIVYGQTGEPVATADGACALAVTPSGDPVIVTTDWEVNHIHLDPAPGQLWQNGLKRARMEKRV